MLGYAIAAVAGAAVAGLVWLGRAADWDSYEPDNGFHREWARKSHLKALKRKLKRVV